MKLSTTNEKQFVDRLIVEKVNSNLIQFFVFLKYIANRYSESRIAQLANGIIQNSKKIPSGSLGAVFSEPTFSYWIYLAFCIKNRIDRSENIPISDLPYYHGIRNPNPDAILEYHLLECNRFIVAAGILARIEVDGEVLFLEDRFYLPILGLHLDRCTPNDRSHVRLRVSSDGMDLLFDGKYAFGLDDAVRSSEVGMNFSEVRNGFGVQPALLGSGGRIIVDRIDPFIRLGWSTIYKNPDGSGYLQLSDSQLNSIMPTVSHAFEVIQESWPEMARNVSSLIRKVHVVESPLPDCHMSCSNNYFFGAILISNGDEWQLSEGIVHEYSHNVLNSIIDSGEFFDGRPPAEEIYYSPWRDDKRHVSGVLHAVFVFSNVSELLERMYLKYEKKFLKAKILNNLVRLAAGIEVLKCFNFKTDLANSVVSDLEENVLVLKSKYGEEDFTESIFLQKAHLDRWVSVNSDGILPESLRQFNFW